MEGHNTSTFYLRWHMMMMKGLTVYDAQLEIWEADCAGVKSSQYWPIICDTSHCNTPSLLQCMLAKTERCDHLGDYKHGKKQLDRFESEMFWPLVTSYGNCHMEKEISGWSRHATTIFGGEGASEFFGVGKLQIGGCNDPVATYLYLHSIAACLHRIHVCASSPHWPKPCWGCREHFG